MAPALPLFASGGGGDFFIAGKLRGIPLVSKSWRANATSENELPNDGSVAAGASEREAAALAAGSRKAGKRDVAVPLTSAASLPTRQSASKAPGLTPKTSGSHGDRIQSQAEVLFKQAGITASIANLVGARDKPATASAATSTMRPRPVISATRRAQAASSTTTRRPPQPPAGGRRTASSASINGRALAGSATRNNQQNRHAAASAPAGETTTISPRARRIEPISSLKMNTMRAMSDAADERPGSVARFQSTPIPAQPPTRPTDASNAGARAPSAEPPTAEATSPNEQATLKTTLTRSMQTLTTQPVNQRRQPQSVVQSRANSNRLLEAQRGNYAGENWYLFNRADGRFSAFELLVLGSNVLIVCTIILVILFNWVRPFKRVRGNNAQACTQAKGLPPTSAQMASVATVAEGGPLGMGVATVANPNPTCSAMPLSASGLSRLDIGSDRTGSKLSRASSGATSQMTAMTTGGFADAMAATTVAAVAAASDIGGTVVSSPLCTSSRPSSAKPARQVQVEMDAAGTGGPLPRIGSAQNIASEFNQTASNVANKAMAIVQPTENNSKSRGLFADGVVEKLKAELAGGGSGASAENVAADQKQKVRPDETNGAAALTGSRSATSTPDRVLALEKLFSGEGKKGQQTKADAQAKEEQLVNSTSSLESIELPNNLVESIKRTTAGPVRKQVNEALAPSPNLLLTEPEPGQESSVGGVLSSQRPPKANATSNQQIGQNPRPENPMSREMAMQEATANKRALVGNKVTSGQGEQSRQGQLQQQEQQALDTAAKIGQEAAMPAAEAPALAAKQQTADVKNHQVVVNKLDKRKTELEIVDLRDESVTGKMRSAASEPSAANEHADSSNSAAWISMDGVAVVHPSASSASGATLPQQQPSPTGAIAMSPSEIIESRFSVDYKSKRKQRAAGGGIKNADSVDSKQEEYVFNNIENELELDNKMKNRKYFVYIVHDGHFTAKKECIARIELPPKRRITLAELRQLIASSQDISLSSLRRNRFKFVTETYRLLNENEDAAVLHQVYPTQGVFLKLNVAETENQVYPFKGGRNATGGSGGALAAGLSSTMALAPGSSLSNTTIASRKKATIRQAREPRPMGKLPAIEVNNYSAGQSLAGGYGRTRAAVGGQAWGTSRGRKQLPLGAYKRSKSNVQTSGSRASGRGGMRRGVSSSNLSNSRRFFDDSLPPENDKRRDDGGDLSSTLSSLPLAEMSEDRVRIN